MGTGRVYSGPVRVCVGRVESKKLTRVQLWAAIRKRQVYLQCRNLILMNTFISHKGRHNVKTTNIQVKLYTDIKTR